MALTSRISRAVEIIVSLKDKISAPAKKVAASFKKIGDQAQSGFKRVSKEADKATSSVGKLRNSVGSLAGRLTGLASAATVGVIINIAASFEKLAISLRTVIGDAEEASEQFKAIREFASTVPVGVAELTNAFIKLKSRGLDPSIESLEAYGNTAAALGKTLDQFVEAVADAATFQFERLREFGIVASQSATQVAFTFQGVTTSVKKDAQSIEQYLKQLGQTNFAGALTDQMDTISGATSNLRDSFDELAVALGEAGLSNAIKVLYRGLAAAVRDAADVIKENASVIGPVLEGLANAIVTVLNGLKIAFNTIQIGFAGAAKAVVDTLETINRVLASVTFGDLSKQYERTADALQATSQELKNRMEQDWQDIKDGATNVADLFTDSENVIRDSNKGLEGGLNERGAIIEKYNSLLADLRGNNKKTADELRTVDLFGPIQDAISAIDSGNYDEALTKTDQLVDTLRKMGEAGKVSSAELQAVARRVQDLALEATREKGLGEALIGDEDEMKQRIDKLRETVGLNPITADLEVNTSEAEATIQAFQSTPVTVPIQFVPVNNPNDVIYNEMVQRGDNG